MTRMPLAVVRVLTERCLLLHAGEVHASPEFLLVRLAVGIYCASGVPMLVTVVLIIAKKPGTGDVDHQPCEGYRDRFCELDLYRRKETHDRLVADQEGDHGEHDGAGVAGKVSKLSGAEDKAGIVSVAPGVGVSQGGDQQGGGVRRHVQSIGDQRERAEERPTGDLCHHHEAAQADHGPGSALVALVTGPQEDVGVGARDGCRLRLHVITPPKWLLELRLASSVALPLLRLASGRREGPG